MPITVVIEVFKTFCVPVKELSVGLYLNRIGTGHSQFIMETQALPSNRPAISVANIETCLSSLYNISVKTIRELTAYDDRNFHIISSDEVNYIFKVTNAKDSHLKRQTMIAQYDLLLFLGKNDICCPQIILNNAGECLSLIGLDGYQHVARLFTYIDGIILENTPKGNIELYRCVGKYCAQLTRTLCSYEKVTKFQRQNLSWSLENATKSRQHLHLITDTETRFVIEKIFNRFDDEVLKKRASFEHGLLHSDLNCANIIVKTAKDDENFKVAGVIDFGEVDWSLLVFDLAILVAHVIEHAGSVNAGTSVIEGYLTERQLSSIELSTLCLAVKTRISQCLVLCSETLSHDPLNSYISEAVRSNQQLLDLINSESEEDILKIWIDKN